MSAETGGHDAARQDDSRPLATAGSGTTRWDTTELVVTEYAGLREEILKLVELQHQHVALTVASLGTVLTVGLSTDEAAIILVHPLLALVLGLSWLHHTFRIHRIAAYIRERVERRAGLDVVSWEHYVNDHALPGGRVSSWALRAAFPASALMALVTGLTVAEFDAPTVVLLVLSLICSGGVSLAVWTWREPAPELLARGRR
jgi:hypothetical protein